MVTPEDGACLAVVPPLPAGGPGRPSEPNGLGGPAELNDPVGTEPGEAAGALAVGPVVLRFTALPEHVRTARLVAVSVARRAGMPPGVLEGVRLAVGEACGRAVQRSESAGLDEMVSVEVASDLERLEISVQDLAGDDGIESEEVALLLMEGLADDVHVTSGPGGPGGTTRLIWRR